MTNELIAEKAFSIHQQVVDLKKQMGLAFLKLGHLLKQIRDESLYETLDYPTFRDYLHSPEVGIHYRTAHYYIDIWETFIERLGYGVDDLVGLSYDRLRKLLPIVKKEQNTSEIMDKAKELRWIDFEREYKSEKLNKGTEYLAPPEFLKCEKCGKWIVILPKSDMCQCNLTRT